MELCSFWSWEGKKWCKQYWLFCLPQRLRKLKHTNQCQTVFQKRTCLISIYRGAAKYNISWKDNAGMICFCGHNVRTVLLKAAWKHHKCPFWKYVYQFKCRWNDRKEETRTRKASARCDTHSLVTGAVRFTEQLWLLTDCGRWAGLSKATTVTFNLPNPHTHK